VGRALAPILMVLGIRRVVCVGSLVKAGDGLLKPLEAALRQRCLGPLNRQLEVWAYAGEANVYARGAAFAALRQHFQCPGSRRTPGAPAVKDL